MINAIRAAPRGRVRYLDLKVLAAIFAAHGFRTASAAEVAAPLNYFLHAAGPAATPTLRLGWVFAAICVGVCLIIAVLLSVAILRRRPMPLLPATLARWQRPAADRTGFTWARAYPRSSWSPCSSTH